MSFNETEIDEALAAATSKESFNVFDFVQGAVTPSDVISIYTNADAALKLVKVFSAEEARKQAEAEEGASLADEYEILDEDIVTALHEELVASRLKISMKGLAPEAIRELDKELKKKHEADSEEYNNAFNHSLIAKSIVSIENPSGALNTDKWTAKMVAGLLSSLYVSEANKIYDAAAELSYVGAIFDKAVNADF